MVEQMQKQMDAESATDERKLRERILETEKILAGLLAKYIQSFGATPWAMNLDAREGAQPAAADDFSQASKAESLENSGLDGTYESRDPSADLCDQPPQDNGTFICTEKVIDQYEAGEGFIDTDPDGMS